MATKAHDVHSGSRVKLVAWARPTAACAHRPLSVSFRHAPCRCGGGTHEEGADDDEVRLLDVGRHVDEQREDADDGKVEHAKEERQPIERPVVADHELAAGGRVSAPRGSSVRARKRRPARPHVARVLGDHAANAAQDDAHRPDQPGHQDLPGPRTTPARPGLARRR